MAGKCQVFVTGTGVESVIGATLKKGGRIKYDPKKETDRVDRTDLISHTT